MLGFSLHSILAPTNSLTPYSFRFFREAFTGFEIEENAFFSYKILEENL